MIKLIIVNGTTGVGKSATCKELYQRLNRSVWLDGDWCWMMNPFVVTEENKRMVEDNITYMLRNFLSNSSFDYVIFNWVIPKEFILDIIIDRLKDLEFKLYKISLVCSEEALKDRILRDENRDLSQVPSSIERLGEYYKMDTLKLDTSAVNVSETVNMIIDIIGV